MPLTKKYKKRFKSNTKRNKRKTASKKNRAGNPPSNIDDFEDLLSSPYNSPPNSPYNPILNNELLKTPTKVTLNDDDLVPINDNIFSIGNLPSSYNKYKSVKSKRPRKTGSSLIREKYIIDNLFNKIYNNKNKAVPLSSLKIMPYIVENHMEHGDINKTQQQYNDWREHESKRRSELRKQKRFREKI